MIIVVLQRGHLLEEVFLVGLNFCKTLLVCFEAEMFGRFFEFLQDSCFKFAYFFSDEEFVVFNALRLVLRGFLNFFEQLYVITQSIIDFFKAGFLILLIAVKLTREVL